MKTLKKIGMSLLFLILISFTCASIFHFAGFFSSPEPQANIVSKRMPPAAAEKNYEAIENQMLDLIGKGEYQKVIHLYSKFITTDNRNPGFYNALGFACMKLKKYETAYYAFKRAYRLDSNNLVILFNLISMAFITNNYREANQLSEKYLLETRDKPDYRKQRELIQEVYRSINEQQFRNKSAPERIPPGLKKIPIELEAEILYAFAAP